MNSLVNRKHYLKARGIFGLKIYFANFSPLLGIHYYLKSELVSCYLEERHSIVSLCMMGEIYIFVYQIYLFILKYFHYLFIWLHWVLVVAGGLLIVACELLVAGCMWDLVP